MFYLIDVRIILSQNRKFLLKRANVDLLLRNLCQNAPLHAIISRILTCSNWRISFHIVKVIVSFFSFRHFGKIICVPDGCFCLIYENGRTQNKYFSLISENKSSQKAIYLGDCNGTRTHNYLVRKRTLNHLAKLAKMIDPCCEYLSGRCIRACENL